MFVSSLFPSRPTRTFYSGRSVMCLIVWLSFPRRNSGLFFSFHLDIICPHNFLFNCCSNEQCATRLKCFFGYKWATVVITNTFCYKLSNNISSFYLIFFRFLGNPYEISYDVCNTWKMHMKYKNISKYSLLCLNIYNLVKYRHPCIRSENVWCYIG